MAILIMGKNQIEPESQSYFTGSRLLEISDESLGISFPVLVHYPTNIPSHDTRFGPYMMDVSVNAEFAPGQFPLILISHGNSGSHLIYRTISIYLAQRGFIVAIPEHYGNNRRNNELAQSIENLKYRTRHCRLTIDQLLNDYGSSILPEKMGIIGHSFGGYTALALAGGLPTTQSGQKVEVESDPRIKALVLMAPAAAYFYAEGSLSQVNLPILLMIAQHDQFTPQQWTSDIILKQVPDTSKVTLRTIENAGHFSFISPFPPSMKNPGFPPSTDPQGFDREAFHRQLPVEIYNFLNSKI
jgi:predicted dienelactone hydrolase